MRKIHIIVLAVMTALASCDTRSTESASLPAEDLTPVHRPETDPAEGWRENEEELLKTMTADIGHYPCSWGKTIGVTETNSKGKVTKREIPCNCATYGQTGIVLIEDSLSPFAGMFDAKLGAVELNRFRIRKGYENAQMLLKGLEIDTVTFIRYANAYLQQELWHKKNGTGSNLEFKSDVVSIKVAGEWFLSQSLMNLVAHENGEAGPDTYGEEYATYKSIFVEAGLDSKDLICMPKEHFGERTRTIIETNPHLLTRAKDIILSRY